MLNTQPIYMQLADLLQEKIEANEYEPGSKIPSERELTEQFEISRMTVRKSIDVLIEKGLLVRIQGKGTYVNTPKIDSPIDEIQSMGKFIQESGLIPSNKVFLAKKRPAGIKYAKIFNLTPDDTIFQLFRLRLGSNEPIALEYTYIPYKLIPDLESYDFQQVSLYELFEQNKIQIESDYQQLEIVRICNPQAKLLKVEEDTSVFMLHNTISDIHGKVIEYTRSYIVGNKLTFSTVLT